MKLFILAAASLAFAFPALAQEITTIDDAAEAVVINGPNVTSFELDTTEGAVIVADIEDVSSEDGVALQDGYTFDLD